jgi:hypothetical protein
MFADHSVGLPSFAIRLSHEPDSPTPVAGIYSDFGALEVEDFFDSFGAFLDCYLDDPDTARAAIPRNARPPAMRVWWRRWLPRGW